MKVNHEHLTILIAQNNSDLKCRECIECQQTAEHKKQSLESVGLEKATVCLEIQLA